MEDSLHADYQSGLIWLILIVGDRVGLNHRCSTPIKSVEYGV